MENNTNPKQQISTPTAIIIAGFLIMVGVLISKGNLGVSKNDLVASNLETKTLSEQVGVSKDALTACIKDADLDAISTNINASIEKAMKHIPQNQRGTPYNIIIGPTGIKTEILGADSYENVQKKIAEVQAGKTDKTYKGGINLSEPSDHIFGSPDAQTTIIEYSDFECPFCKQFHPILKKIVTESNDTVRWIYRDYPLHQHSFEKLVAARCVAQIKGNNAYWKYSDLLFGMLKTAQDPISDQL